MSLASAPAKASVWEGEALAQHLLSRVIRQDREFWQELRVFFLTLSSSFDSPIKRLLTLERQELQQRRLKETDGWLPSSLSHQIKS